MDIIKPEETIYNMVKQYPTLIDVLVEQSPKFKKLKNKLMFHTMAKIATVKDVAKIGNLDLNELLLVLNRSINREDEYLEYHVTMKIESQEKGFKTDNELSKWLKTENEILTIDVRDLGEETFSNIKKLLENTKEGSGFCIIQGFEPTPLYTYIEKKGFQYKTEKISENEYKVFIYRGFD